MPTGVNAFLDEPCALPPEFLLAGDRPEPWKPADSLVIAKLEAYQLSQSFKLKLLRARLLQKLGPDQANWLFPGASPASRSRRCLRSAKGTRERESVDDKIGALTGIGPGASNEWVIAGSRTQTGKPILANDPHLDLSAPILWYLARIVTPEGSVKGATIPGAPVFVLGQNDSIAWGLTTADSNVEDLFVETVDPSDPAKYLTPDGPKPFDTREETIRVKGAADVKLAIRTTRHGPVLSDVSADVASIAEPGKVVALAFAGLGDRDTTAEAFLRVNAARNWGEFLDALRLYQTPTQNLVYADVAGNIGFFNPGLVPTRNSGDGPSPLDGASGAFDWTGMIPFDQMPQLYNPEIGFAFNANNADFPPDHQPSFGFDYEENFRARRIQQFFDTIAKHSLETSAAMQADHLSLDVKEMHAVHRHDRAIQRLCATGPGDAHEVGRRDDQRPRRAAGLHRFPRRAAQDPARGPNRAADEGKGPVRRDDADFSSPRPSFVVRCSRRARSGLPQGARARSRRRPRAIGQARRRRHEPVGMGRGAPGAACGIRSTPMCRCLTG